MDGRFGTAAYADDTPGQLLLDHVERANALIDLALITRDATHREECLQEAAESLQHVSDLMGTPSCPDELTPSISQAADRLNARLRRTTAGRCAAAAA